MKERQDKDDRNLMAPKNNRSKLKRRRQIDWESIEQQYRAGVLAVNEIARQY